MSIATRHPCTHRHHPKGPSNIRTPAGILLLLALVPAALHAEAAGGVTRLAVLDAQGTVVNIVVAGPHWAAPPGHTARLATAATELGGTWANGQFLPRASSVTPTDTAARRREVLLANIEDVWTAFDGGSPSEREAARQRVRDALTAAQTAQ